MTTAPRMTNSSRCTISKSFPSRRVAAQREACSQPPVLRRHHHYRGRPLSSHRQGVRGHELEAHRLLDRSLAGGFEAERLDRRQAPLPSLASPCAARSAAVAAVSTAPVVGSTTTPYAARA